MSAKDSKSLFFILNILNALGKLCRSFYFAQVDVSISQWRTT